MYKVVMFLFVPCERLSTQAPVKTIQRDVKPAMTHVNTEGGPVAFKDIRSFMKPFNPRRHRSKNVELPLAMNAQRQLSMMEALVRMRAVAA